MPEGRVAFIKEDISMVQGRKQRVVIDGSIPGFYASTGVISIAPSLSLQNMHLPICPQMIPEPLLPTPICHNQSLHAPCE